MSEKKIGITVKPRLTLFRLGLFRFSALLYQPEDFPKLIVALGFQICTYVHTYI